MDPRASQLITSLGLRPHPEGGHYVEVYRSRAVVQPADGRSDRAALTTIYFLLTAGEVSRWHRVLSDEVWHHYEGAPLELWTADDRFDEVTRHVLGRLGAHDESQPVHVVHAHKWQAARTTGAYTLVGCTVAPGFEFDDFAMLRERPAAAGELRQRHPHLAAFISDGTGAVMDRKAHWETLYRTTRHDQASWFQREASTSLALIRSITPDPASRIIDIGGGASMLVDGLLASGYGGVTILDVSPTALAAAATRLGSTRTRVRWIEADVLEADLPCAAFDVWHDRAVFHFLIEPADRARYAEQARCAVKPGGHVIIAAFAEDGPTRCSGLPVVRYTPDALRDALGAGFVLIESVREEHVTPSGTTQAFVYCLCRFGNRPAMASDASRARTS